MGGTVGISIGQAIYSSVLKRKINRIPDLSGIDTSPSALAESVRTLQHLSVSKGRLLVLLRTKRRVVVATRKGADHPRLRPVDKCDMDFQYPYCRRGLHHG